MPFIKYEPPVEDKRCNSPEHNPPTHQVFPPGFHVWKCPVCGAEQGFEVPVITF